VETVAGQFSVLVAVEAAGPGRGGGITAVLADEQKDMGMLGVGQGEGKKKAATATLGFHRISATVELW